MTGTGPARKVTGGVSAMLDRLNYIWRLIGTGIAFASFGLGGLFMSVFIFIPIALFTKDEATRIRRVRGVIYRAFRVFVYFLRVGGIIDSRFHETEKLKDVRGALIVANHPSLLDTVFLMSRMPDVQCIVKHELWDNPYLGGVMRAAGYIRNDGDAEMMLRQCEKALGSGQNILVFPEGTRSVPGQALKFQRGFANIATHFNAPIQLVTIKCEPSTLTKGSPWYAIPPRQARFDITFNEQLDMADYLRHEPRSLKVRKLTRELEQYYIGKLCNE
ncbi:1-acyl-sn-glycerol-3-phosphate acyltransferase [Sneathiella chungangensis]|uniref:1-acyl-sn-glycerol-3-phosphate acyltransferase n=1 Tax=Sneathiella chungangensis TaxID=1418234 RepID=A0A845MGU4_9PROT|nr:1-acyl-sn-glycerol-3-phosphate acyltransferase [Sneathiella chungangensis]MZR22911.1 1-acyl-sn-glycerol-3-phosphate acyltransferase [Sneathiella chungangensis]